MKAFDYLVAVLILAIVVLYLFDRRAQRNREEEVAGIIDEQKKSLEAYELSDAKTKEVIDSLFLITDEAQKKLKALELQQVKLHRANEKLFDKYNSLNVTRPEF